MNILSTLPQAKSSRSDGQRFVMHAIDWITYRKISEALTGCHYRLTYDGENLEFMTKSSKHGWFSRFIAMLVRVLAEEVGITIQSCGDMTCDRADLERGLEPDECFYLTNEPLVRSKDEIDLETDPPPDLAVEVDITRSSLKRLPIYAAIRVPEVWRYDGQVLTIHQLGADGKYAVAERSRYFAFVTGPDLARFLNQRTQIDENSLIRTFRDWVREQIAAGR